MPTPSTCNRTTAKARYRYQRSACPQRRPGRGEGRVLNASSPGNHTMSPPISAWPGSIPRLNSTTRPSNPCSRRPAWIPLTPNAHYLLSQAYSHAGQDARADSQMAIFQRLSAAERHYNQGVKTAKQGQWNRARRPFFPKHYRAIPPTCRPISAWVWRTLHQQDSHRGIAVLTRGLDLDAGNVEVHCLLGEAYLLKKQPAKADSFLCRCPGPGFNLGAGPQRQGPGLPTRTGTCRRRRPLSQKALAIDPDHRDSYYRLGLTYLETGSTPKSGLQPCANAWRSTLAMFGPATHWAFCFCATAIPSGHAKPSKECWRKTPTTPKHGRSWRNWSRKTEFEVFRISRTTGNRMTRAERNEEPGNDSRHHHQSEK